MQTMKIGELSKASGCHAQSIRHYEQVGLLPPSRRTPTGHRRYSSDDVKRLKFVRSARDEGLSLAAIRDLLGRLGVSVL
jgi:DNA-binding transcriptional MerR regulator